MNLDNLQDSDLIQVAPNGKTIWVHASDGSTVGRFDRVFGLDVHRTVTDQMAGANQCLHCTHEKPTGADWIEFCEQIQRHHGIRVDPGLMTFENEPLPEKP